jgi:adenylate kinase family enzyme
LLRDEVKKGTVLGQEVESIMKSGGLVSSAMMVTLMNNYMKDHPGKRILLDGFPRSQENARDLVTLCGKPELALHLDCDDTILLERIMKRAQSGERADDNFQTAIQRIRTYHKYHQLTIGKHGPQHICFARAAYSHIIARSTVRLPPGRTCSYCQSGLLCYP